MIVPTALEAHYVLGDFLGNATDLPVYEHATPVPRGDAGVLGAQRFPFRSTRSTRCPADSQATPRGDLRGRSRTDPLVMSQAL